MRKTVAVAVLTILLFVLVPSYTSPSDAAPSSAPLITEVDLVLLMSVDPGFGGQAFIESTIPKIKQLRDLCKRYHVKPWIEIDGGIDTDNADNVCAAGANVLVAGSSIFGKDDVPGAVRALREAGNIGNLRRF